MKNKIFIKLFVLLFFITACDDTLDFRLSTSIPAGEVITDLESLDLAVNGSYGLLGDSDLFNRTATLLPDLMSDNLYLDAFNNTGRYLFFDDYTVQDDNGNVESLYNDLARIIAQTTIILREVENVDFPDSELALANQYKGEAKFVRALAYFTMQQFFAQPYNFTNDASHLGVPIPDAEALGGNSIVSPARATTAAVYALIVSDLQEAITLMDATSDVFRADVWAAEALLARVYLNMGNYPQAEARASNVINSSGAILVSNGSYISSWSAEKSSETIFSVANILTDNSGFDSVGYFYNGYDDAFPTPDFLSQFEATDVRNGLYEQQGAPNGLEFSILKYPDTQNQSDNIPILRLSEMFLIKAEAHARQPGQETMAQGALDAIITRADGSAAPSTETGQALINKIILERRKELAFEGFRLFDLTRTKRDFQKFRQDLPPLSITAQGNFTILPIPLDELNRNPNIEPNPGY
ncbi:RagB/SusD family nutrient uptake outer membrane protein [Nonlabens antarcticus]|uniref:RagB/SusD family nutrient uptake outer membrane protein n=1 Tax=Nonlabens antarcticus TaxID=392714 RepID=UPI001891799F|nr:RagB/SusD family nutrient uptake outer membrane protein [Nonlabens antarcticus]